MEIPTVIDNKRLSFLYAKEKIVNIQRIFQLSDNKKVLYIAYHFPPILGSSGVHRTLAFTRYLSEHDWHVTVLTASLKAYDKWEKSQVKFIPDSIKVNRAFARNTAKQLSFKGKYLAWMALPDNWQSWIIGGFFSGLVSIYKNRPKVIVSTYPIASAHVIAYLLHKVSGIPWVADFRDPMAQDDYPNDQRKKKIFEWIEKKAVKHAKNVVLTAPGAVKFYQDKFPDVNKDFWQLVPNGFDEHIFSSVISSIFSPKKPSNTLDVAELDQNKSLTVLHSGVIYPSERDPSDLFQAIAELKREQKLSWVNFQLVLRATGHDIDYQSTLTALDITDIVVLAPPIPYQEALEEMLKVDGLLLLQADNCDFQIPAKVYEYIRAQKPVLALTSITGDTGRLLNAAGVASITPLNDKEKIKVAIMDYVDKIRSSSFKVLSEEETLQYSRQTHAKTFEHILHSAIS